MLALFIGLVGLLGISGMTWLCPVLGIVWSTVTSCGRKKSRIGAANIASVVVAIPAYNEARALPPTLESVSRAAEELRSCAPSIQVQVLVGDDGSFDRTASIAADRGALIISAERSEGKWRMLQRLVAAAGEADAIVFADAGIEWPAETLIRLIEAGGPPDVLGVAPAYRIANGGTIARVVWWLERILKTLENPSGGPVSVHGATVMYRTQPLREALKKLSGPDFLNDDVVIPLTLRRLFPNGRIEYLPRLVMNDEVDPRTPERRRRSRLMQGNLQWLAWGARGEGLVELIAARRIFRVFWVYWLTALLVPFVGGLIAVAPSVGIASLGVLLGALLSPWKPTALERFLDAAAASFRAPRELIRLSRNRTTSSGGAIWR